MVVKKQAKPIIKKNYDIKISCNVPAVIHYTVLAESPEEALQILKKSRPIPKSIKYELEKRKELKATVYDYMTNMIRFFKSIVGRL